MFFWIERLQQKQISKSLFVKATLQPCSYGQKDFSKNRRIFSSVSFLMMPSKDGNECLSITLCYMDVKKGNIVRDMDFYLPTKQTFALVDWHFVGVV